jgi:hypothetical protein
MSQEQHRPLLVLVVEIERTGFVYRQPFPTNMSMTLGMTLGTGRSDDMFSTDSHCAIINKLLRKCTCDIGVHGSPDKCAKFLIDIAHNTVVRTEIVDDVPYAALSCVLGPRPGPRLVDGMLDQKAITASLRNIKLPQTYVEAMALAAKLGFAYIWIDELCIMHENGRTDADQINKMDGIYGNASVVLMATVGASVDFGLYPKHAVSPDAVRGRFRPTARTGDHQWALVGPEDAAMRLRPSEMQYEEYKISDAVCDAIELSRHATRAWCFQEDILARRKLYVTGLGIRLQCHCCDVVVTLLQRQPEQQLRDAVVTCDFVISNALESWETNSVRMIDMLRSQTWRSGST